MGKSSRSNLVVILFAFAMAAVMILGGLEGAKVLSAKTDAQRAVTESINRWRQSFRALEGTVTQWKKTYTASSRVPDLRTLIALINLESVGLRADTDSLVLTNALQVSSNGIALGLSKICLGTSGDSFLVQAVNYDTLLKGIEKIANRPDIFIDNISIQGNKPVPQALLGQFCVLLRNE